MNLANLTGSLTRLSIFTVTLWPLSIPGGARATRLTGDSHVVGALVCPTNAKIPHSAIVPNASPTTEITVPPAVGPLPGVEKYTIGEFVVIAKGLPDMSWS